MSNLSIFDKKWIDVVFDGKNQEYGAYQLRQENQKTSLRAFALGTIMVLSCLGIFTLSSFSSDNVVNFDPEISIPIELKTLNFPEEEIIPIVKIIKTKSTRTFTEDKKLVNPIVTTSNNAVDNIVKNDDNNKVTNSPVTPFLGQKPLINGGDDGIEKVAVPKIIDNTIKTSADLDKQPSFPNGIDKFYSYVGSNFNKPELDDEKIMTVRVSFIVEKDGTMSNIKVLEDPGYGLGAEAIRVLKSLKTKWIPGILNGEPMRTAYNLPISVKLE
jgi:periplasmic protein TonB